MEGRQLCYDGCARAYLKATGVFSSEIVAEAASEFEQLAAQAEGLLLSSGSGCGERESTVRRHRESGESTRTTAPDESSSSGSR